MQIQYFTARIHGADTATVEVFIDGERVLELSRVLDAAAAFWAVAYINVDDDGDVTVRQLDLVGDAGFDN